MFIRDTCNFIDGAPHANKATSLQRIDGQKDVRYGQTSMTLLQQRDVARRQHRVQLREQTRARLRSALAELIPGERVVVFGSLTRAGIFNDASDIDLALEREPGAMSTGCLMVELMERLGREVDVVLLPECRFREKILREGETWTI